MASTDLNKILSIARLAALEAGTTIRHAYSSNASALSIKSSSTDLVTETDRRCEELISKRIRDNFPNHEIIGEEDSGAERYVLGEGPTWTIDPIDGTTNFVHRLKLSCILISYIEQNEVLVGITYDPYADELFYAIKGRGSFLQSNASTYPDINNSIPIRVSNTTTLSQAVISMDPGYGRDTVAVSRYCKVQSSILSASVRNIRVIGCTGLNMAWVACGRLDGGFEEGSWDGGRGPKIWDFACGRLLVEEAGGVTLDIEEGNKSRLNLMGRSFFCASCQSLADEIIECIFRG